MHRPAGRLCILLQIIKCMQAPSTPQSLCKSSLAQLQPWESMFYPLGHFFFSLLIILPAASFWGARGFRYEEAVMITLRYRKLIEDFKNHLPLSERLIMTRRIFCVWLLCGNNCGKVLGFKKICLFFYHHVYLLLTLHLLTLSDACKTQHQRSKAVNWIRRH